MHKSQSLNEVSVEKEVLLALYYDTPQDVIDILQKAKMSLRAKIKESLSGEAPDWIIDQVIVVSEERANYDIVLKVLRKMAIRAEVQELTYSDVPQFIRI